MSEEDDRPLSMKMVKPGKDAKKDEKEPVAVGAKKDEEKPAPDDEPAGDSADPREESE
jgi:hypothetical protein